MWSVVVSQPSTPGRACQIRSRRSDPLGGGGGASRSPLLQASPGRRRAPKSSGRELAVSGIWLPGLTSCESRSTRARSARRVRDRQRREHRAASRGASGRARRSPSPRCLGSRGSSAHGRRGRPAVPPRRPRPRPASTGRRASAGTRRAVARRRRTPCARAAARRTRRIGPGSARRVGVRARPQFVCPGIMSIVRLSRGTQKLWMTSAVRTSTRTGRADGDVDLVCRDGVGAGITDLPPPHVPDDVDGQLRRRPARAPPSS